MTIGVRSVEKPVRFRRVILDISVWSVLTGRLMNMDGDYNFQTSHSPADLKRATLILASSGKVINAISTEYAASLMKRIWVA